MKPILSSLAAIALCGTASAQDILSVDALSVTATRTERKAQDVPASITIINQSDIQNAVANSADELLKEVAGVNIKHSNGIVTTGTANKVTMRGFGGGTESRTLLLIDGVPMNDSYFAGVEWNQIPVDAIERIEIVKGAGSALYGSNAMGGVINIITKAPDTVRTDVEYTRGNMNTNIGVLTTTGKAGDFGYFLSGQMMRSDGYMADTDANTKENSIKRGSNRENGNLKLTYDLSENAKLKASYIYLHNHTTGVLDVPGGYNPYEQTMTTLQGDYTQALGSDTDMKLSLFKKTSETSYDSLNSNKLSIKYQDEADIDEIGGTLQMTTMLGDHVLTGGADFKYGEALSSDVYLATSELSTTEGNQDYYGIFLQDEIFVNEKLIINIGGRYDSYRNHSGKRYDETQDPTFIIDFEETEFDAFSPKIGAVYHVDDAFSVRASVGKAFRAPTVYDLYRTWLYYSYVYASNPDLKPETVLSYELGIDQKLGNHGIFSLTGYYSNAEDFIYSITPDPSEPTHKEKTNVGKVIIKGLEAELQYAFNPTWKLLANYTYNVSKIDTFDPDPSLEGNYLTDVPQDKGSLSLTYKNPKAFNAKATWRYVGKRYSDDANKESKAYGSYALVDLKLSRKFRPNLTVEVSVDDLFNKGYTEYYVSPGRVVMGSAKISF